MTPTQMATYGAYPFDDGVGGTQTDLWQQVDRFGRRHVIAGRA